MAKIIAQQHNSQTAIGRRLPGAVAATLSVVGFAVAVEIDKTGPTHPPKAKFTLCQCSVTVCLTWRKRLPAVRVLCLTLTECSSPSMFRR